MNISTASGLPLLLLLVVLLIVSCSGRQKIPQGTVLSPGSDGAPPALISADEVRDAIPRADPILSAGNRTPYTVNGVSYDILPDHRGYRERGLASWYGTKFDGRPTSNGEVYDLYAATAAHKTLPIPCYARVTNLENGRSVIVRINDRGPFHSDRLIDLSYAAAVKLGYMHNGTAEVEVEVIDVTGADDRRATTSGDYRFLQMGAFASEASAEQLRHQIVAQLSLPTLISPVQTPNGLLYRVRVGPVENEAALQDAQARLRAGGFGAGQPLP
ncbi:MAG: septal ring lytic transglycosylase RlpA family protein [Parahaliea sp.]